LTVEPRLVRQSEWGASAEHTPAVPSTSPGISLQNLRRSKLDVCFDVMNAIWEGQEVKPTHLMQTANLSWRVLKDILGYLNEKGLIMINQVSSRRTVAMTDLGTTCLEHLHAARRIFQTDAEPEDSEDFTQPKRTFPMGSSMQQASTRGRSVW
jgi:predicted transcriptional regulator